MEIRADIRELMNKCIRCGRCLKVCTSHPKGGCNPLEVMKGNLESAKGCVACGMCNRVCSHTIPKKVMMYAVNRVNNVSIPKSFYETGYNLPFASTENVPVPRYVKGAGAQLMPGCQVVALAPYLEYASERALDLIGVSTERYEGGCCTYPVPFRGLTDDERNRIKKEHSRSLGRRKLFAICPGCAVEMKAGGFNSEHVIYPLYRGIDIIRRLPGVHMKVAIQTGCNLRDEYKLFREIAEACGCTVVQKEQGCCGKNVPVISERIMSDRQSDLKDVDAVVVGCPSCFARYDLYPEGVPVIYITELIMMAYGDSRTVALHRIPISH